MTRVKGSGQNPPQGGNSYVGGHFSKEVYRLFLVAYHRECAVATERGDKAPTRLRFLESLVRKAIASRANV